MTNDNNSQGQGPDRTTDQPLSRFRPRYRTLTAAELKLHDQIKDTAEVLCTLIEQIPPSRDRSLAVTRLEDSIMRAVRALTADQGA